MKKDAQVFIKHILECIELIEEYTKGKSKADFLASKQLQDAVIRRIEIIGEAAKNLSGDIKDKYAGIPWKRIAGMRDILIHEYFGIDLELAWKVVETEISGLKRNLNEVKK